MSQLSFFEVPAHCRSTAARPQATPPIARASDPATSHEAAAEITQTGVLGECAETFLQSLASCAQPATANEVAQIAAARNPGHSAESYRKRAKELERAGRIAIAGTRKCSLSGKNATIYRVS